MIVPKHYENLNVLHEGCMAPRAYYIPASCRMEDPVEDRTASDRMQLLNGTWEFRYYESIYDVQEPFFEETASMEGFAPIPVPSVWQMQGFDSNQYTNVRYPFPFDPPFVPADIPCGAYVCSFPYEKDTAAPRAYLNFEGVDSCFYVWLNGQYLGYSQVSHCISEFDVSAMIKEGTNRLAVLCLKWCDGSYLEDQDKFRMSGIFRDVYLLKRPKEHIRDYRIRTEIGKTSASIRVEASFRQLPVKASLSLYDANGLEIASGLLENGTAELTVDNPVLWNAEAPYLYTLVITAPGEVITEYVGLRKVEITDRVLYLNGQKIKFRGINRHDSDPLTGPAVSLQQVKKDLQLMKQHNINAIRSSHYPNAPFVPQLCDRYGFMLVDEADLEAHGPEAQYYGSDASYKGKKYWSEKITDDPAWEAPVLDRVERLVRRDVNRPCVLIWSMGNESAYGCCIEKVLRWTKTFDPERITQYESARYRNYDRTYDYADLDLYSRMYPSLEEIREYWKKDGSKPYILIEYCHAMGNGPGDLEDYFRLIQSNDGMCGGFIWEWCDHAIYKGIADNGKPMYFYGGDHGEKLHDGNFCMDGMVYPDRRIHTGLLEFKNVHRPVRIESYDSASGELKLKNYLDFTDLSDAVKLHYELTCDGQLPEEGDLETGSIPPHQTGTVKLKLSCPASGKVYIKLSCVQKNDCWYQPAGTVLGFDELALANDDSRFGAAAELCSGPVSVPEAETDPLHKIKLHVSETDRKILLEGETFRYSFDKTAGLFDQLTVNGNEFFERPMELNIWRAPTDNDRKIKHIWRAAHYPDAYARAYSTDIAETAEGIRLSCRMSLLADSIQKILDIDAVYIICSDGRIHADFKVAKNTEFPDLPRFGLRLFLPKRFEELQYFGMGPLESYRDKHRASFHGRFSSTVSAQHEDYLRPQENGSHFDCNFVQLSATGKIPAAADMKLTAASEEGISFNVSHYTQEELEAKAHNFELEESPWTVLCLDYALNGIGSNSCGPVVLDEYRFKESEFRFRITLLPQ